MQKEKLKPQQEAAAKYVKDPLSIVAGPGAGKTKVLIHKVKHLIENEGILPSEIVLTTFTIKASEELRKRIQGLMPDKDISAMFIGTIHSFCDNLIRQYGGTRGIPLDYTVIDEIERFIFLRKNFGNLDLTQDELRLLKKPRLPGELIKDTGKFYDTVTENLVDVQELMRFVNINKDGILKQYKIDNNENEIYEVLLKLIKSYGKYIDLLNELKFMDFALLEKNAHSLLQYDGVLKDIKEKIKFVLIDEFQDINPIQWKIFKKIIGHRENVSVVGDKNQSIYGFRGSNPNIFDKFITEFKNAKQKELNINFRSKKEIVDFANKFLKDRDAINIKPDRQNENTEIYYIDGEYEVDSTRKILNLYEKLYKDKKIKRFGEVALLFRSVKSHGKVFIELLDREFKNIPYSVNGGTNFLENEEVRSLIFFISYLCGLDEESIVTQLTGYDNFFNALENILFPISKKTIEILKEHPELDIRNITDPEIFMLK